MKARLKPNFELNDIALYFDWELQVIRKNRSWKRVLLENNFWYDAKQLYLTKESGWYRHGDRVKTNEDLSLEVNRLRSLLENKYQQLSIERNKKELWKSLFITSVVIDVVYILIKSFL